MERAAPHRRFERLVDVADGEADVFHPVTVDAHVVDDTRSRLGSLGDDDAGAPMVHGARRLVVAGRAIALVDHRKAEDVHEQ